MGYGTVGETWSNFGYQLTNMVVDVALTLWVPDAVESMDAIDVSVRPSNHGHFLGEA